MDEDSVVAFAMLSDGAWHHLDQNPAVAIAELRRTRLPEGFERLVCESGIPLTDDATIVLFTRPAIGN